MTIKVLTIDPFFTTWSWGDFAGLGLILHILLMIVMTLRIVSVQRNIGVSIAWIAVLYTLPVFGKANGFYFAWKQQESGIEVTKWFYARPIQTKVPTYTKEELVKIVGHEFNIKEE